MTSTINITEMKEEVVTFLRNQDIFSITERSVVTDNDTGTFAGDSTHLINRTNIKNIRSIEVGGSPLAFGTDYNVDYNFDDAGTIKTKITFTVAQTGAYDIEHDYGSDRIFGDLPKVSFSISLFPRIGVDFVGISTSEMGIGAYSNSTDVSLSIYVYSTKMSDIDTYMNRIRTAILINKKNFYYFSFMTLASVGPSLLFADGKQKIYQRNIDIISLYNIEEV